MATQSCESLMTILRSAALVMRRAFRGCAAGAVRTDGWVVLGARRLPRAAGASVSGDARSLAAARRCDAHAGRLRAARQRRHRDRRSAPDDRRAEAGMGEHPDAGGHCSCAARDSTAARPRSSTATRRACWSRAPGARSLALEIVVPIEAAGGIESMTLPASASARVGGHADRAAHRHRPDRQRRLRRGADREPTPRTAGRCTDRRDGRSSSPGSARSTIARSTLPLRAKARDHRARRARRGCDRRSPSSVRVEVVQGLARDVVLAMPEGVSVNQVSGATVADWKHESGSLTVSFLEPIDRRRRRSSCLPKCARRVKGRSPIPIVRMPAAERETGGVAVDVIGAGEITDRQPRGVDPADPSDLGDILEGRESPSMVAFGFKPLAGSAAAGLTVTVSRYTPQAVLVANVEEARYEVLVAEDGKLLVRARYAVRNNQRAFLALKLPAQSVLWSAALAGRPVRPGVWPTAVTCCRCSRDARARTRRRLPSSSSICSARLPGARRARRGSSCRPSIFPVSRTGLVVNYSPRFHVEPQARRVPRERPGQEPWSRSASQQSSATAPARLRHRDTPAPPRRAGDRDAASAKALVERFRKEWAGRTAGVDPGPRDRARRSGHRFSSQPS